MTPIGFRKERCGLVGEVRVAAVAAAAAAASAAAAAVAAGFQTTVDDASHELKTAAKIKFNCPTS